MKLLNMIEGARAYVSYYAEYTTGGGRNSTLKYFFFFATPSVLLVKQPEYRWRGKQKAAV
jgi:hypothetical protein